MDSRKKRIQFYIDKEANRQLDIIAKKLDVSKASLIRKGVDKVLMEKRGLTEDPAYKLIGLMNDKGKEQNVAENHDHYLYGKSREKDD